MNRSPYPAPAACTAPRLGAEATQALGRALPTKVAAHLAACGACRLERVAFGRAALGVVPPAPGARERLRARLQRGAAH
jgi:hypothetical protein